MEPFHLAILLYVAALTVAGIDLFVPSGGMLIIFASLAAIGSILFGFRASASAGMLMLTLVLGTIPVFVFTAVKIWPHTPLGRRVILGLPSQRPESSESAVESLSSFLGKVLLAETALMPMGQLRVGYRRFSALAESGFIEAGGHVEVIAIRERTLIVRPTSKPLSGQSPQTSIDAPQQPSEKLLEQSAEELGLDSLDD